MSKMNETENMHSSRNTTKTDLCMLLECLKFQMKSPDLQKQALLTIHSICENREDNVDLLREMGGVLFLLNLSRSSVVHPEVKETALFTLGTLAEANVYCKDSLCRKDIFASVAEWIRDGDIPLAQKRVSVYLLFVLVANNKTGQTLAQTTGCLDILLDLFRSTFPENSILIAPNATQTYQLWTSVSSALCGCVNNPQNEDGQRICVAIFPILKTWLQQIQLPHTEICQTICSFIAMTVSNNSFVQESFFLSGGLKILTLTLVRVASAAHTSLLSYQLSIILSKTLSACIADKPALASGLAEYHVVFHLFSLLASPHLDPEDRLSVLLTLGHFTEASEVHQTQLVKCGGLPLIITLLTEDTDEDVKKAATFLLQTCKEATTCFGECSVKENKSEQALTDLEDFRISARELLHKLDLIGETQKEDVPNEKGDIYQPRSTLHGGQPFLPPVASSQHRKEFKKPFLVSNRAQANDGTKVQSHAVGVASHNLSQRKTHKIILSPQHETSESSRVCELCSACQATGALLPSCTWPLEGDNELHPADRELHNFPLFQDNSNPNKSTLMKENRPREKPLLSNVRCAGCVLPFEEITSRTFTSLQNSCHNNCDMHRILQEATEHFRIHYCRLLFRKETRRDIMECNFPNAKRGLGTELQRKEYWSKPDGDFCREGPYTPLPSGLSLTPLRRRTTKDAPILDERIGPSLAPLKRRTVVEEVPVNSVFALKPKSRRNVELQPTISQRREKETSQQWTSWSHRYQLIEVKNQHCSCKNKRARRGFSHPEVKYLLSGAKTYGFSLDTV